VITDLLVSMGQLVPAGRCPVPYVGVSSCWQANHATPTSEELEASGASRSSQHNNWRTLWSAQNSG